MAVKAGFGNALGWNPGILQKKRTPSTLIFNQAGLVQLRVWLAVFGGRVGGRGCLFIPLESLNLGKVTINARKHDLPENTFGAY